MHSYKNRKTYGDLKFSQELTMYLKSEDLTMEEMFLVHGLADLSVLLKIKLENKNKST